MIVLEHTDMINVAMVPHPFAVERINAQIGEGKNIVEMIAEFQPDEGLVPYAHVYLNGDYILRDKWHLVRPKAGTVVSIRMLPMGGGGGSKNPLRTVLSLAVMASTGYLAAGIGSSSIFGGSFMGMSVGKLAIGGVNLVANLALNALAPPPKPRFSSEKESPTLFIQGAKNQAMPFGRVPKVLGKHRFVPPFGALPYTETIGNDQYIRMLFVWGYGPLEISDLKIGETPLSEFDDVEIETRLGYDTDEPITLYSNSVLQNNLQIKLISEDGYVTRTTEANIDEISVDITMPRGLLKFDNRGNKVTTSVLVDVEYAEAGTENWIVAENVNLTAKQSSALRHGIRFKVIQGQYDVRLRRVTTDSTDDNVFDEVTWTALRSIRYEDPINKKGLAVTALRIKATDQLNGVVDRFNGVVESILPDWNGDEWVEQKTSNPAAMFRHVLQGAANARPLDDMRLDLSKIEEWHENCALKNREFNSVIDYNVSVREVLQDIAATGRASPSLIDGKWAIVEDKTQNVPIQHFTPRNTFGFKGERAFGDLPHGLRVRFINSDKGWLQDERLVFDLDYTDETASKYETLEMIGVTDPDQIWRDGKYHMATARLRPERYNFYTDVEHIVCTRGDLIRFTHDVPMFGLMSARVKSFNLDGDNITDVTFDTTMPMEANKNYSVRFRKSDGASIVVPVITNVGNQITLVLTTSVSIALGPEVGDLALFGEAGQESAALVVKSIEPQSDLNAKITCVAYTEEVFNDDETVAPEFVSHVEVPVEMQRVPTPMLEQVQSGLETVIKHADGSITSRIIITFLPSILSNELSINTKIKASGESVYRNATIMHRTSSEVSITDVEEGEFYDIQLRYVDNTGAMSAPLTISNHMVEGTAAIPSDVLLLDMNILGDAAYLSWSAVKDVDLSNYSLRFTPEISAATWGGSVDLISHIAKDATSITVPAMVGTYLLKAVDLGGRESSNAISVISNIAGLSSLNIVENLIEDSVFTGECNNTAIANNHLTLIGADTIEDWDNVDTVLDIDIGEDGVVANGTYNFANNIDLGSSYISRLTANMNVLGSDVYDVVDVYSDIDVVESWDQLIDPSLFNVKLQLRTTDDDPLNAPTWGEWQNFVVGDYSARAYEFRTLLESHSKTIMPKVSRLRVNVDMPDRIDAQNDLTSDVSGSTINFVSGFKATPAISITAQDMVSGDYYTIINITNTSFDIRFFNSSGTGVVRAFDYLAKGYGQN